jgi:predicted DNA-binding ribbon-helix-helix protein
MKKISVSLSGHQTSISIEDIFIDTLRAIANHRGISVASIINEIDRARGPDSNLSAEIRIWIVQQLLKTAKL